MKTNEQKQDKRVTGVRIAVDAIIVIIGISGIVLLAGDEAPDAAVPMTAGEWISIKAVGFLLLGVAALIRYAALHSGIIDD